MVTRPPRAFLVSMRRFAGSLLPRSCPSGVTLRPALCRTRPLFAPRVFAGRREPALAWPETWPATVRREATFVTPVGLERQVDVGAMRLPSLVIVEVAVLRLLSPLGEVWRRRTPIVLLSLCP